MAYTIVFKNCSVILPSQEHLEGCPIHHVPLAVHVPKNPEEIVPEGAFAGSVLAPGCRDFGYKAFAECCSLQWVYALEGVANMFTSEAKGNSSFKGVLTLLRTSEPAPGCLSSTGITALALTKHFVAVGAHACDSCRLLESVDLSNTLVEEIRSSPLCTALASETFFFRLLFIQSESRPS